MLLSSSTKAKQQKMTMSPNLGSSLSFAPKEKKSRDDDEPPNSLSSSALEK
jgi:hypothetical protein